MAVFAAAAVGGWASPASAAPGGSVTANGALLGWGDNALGQAGAGPSVTTQLRPNLVPPLSSGVRQVAVGLVFSVALLTDGTVYSWGNNQFGTFGNGTIGGADRFTPMPVPGLSGVSQIAVGSRHVLAVKSDGSVLAWGNNSGQQLGDGTTSPHLTPFQVPGLSGIVQVAAGAAHSLARRSDGTVLGWGTNLDGQLGDGTRSLRPFPTQVATPTGIVQITAGFTHSMAVRSDGTLWAWGDNSRGELGLGTAGTTNLLPVQVPGLSGVTGASGGLNYSLAVADPGGAVWAWGYNGDFFPGEPGFGQLGDGTNTERHSPVRSSGLSGIVQVSASQQDTGAESAAVGADGSLWTWGANTYGHLGINSTDPFFSLVPIRALTTAPVQQVAAGAHHDLAIAAAHNCTFTTTRPTIMHGSSGVAVKQAQCYLNDVLTPARHLPLTVDGIFGTGTTTAVRALQACLGRTVDGIVGPNTWSVLAQAANASTYLC